MDKQEKVLTEVADKFSMGYHFHTQPKLLRDYGIVSTKCSVVLNTEEQVT
jgi:hypothetical protein